MNTHGALTFRELLTYLRATTGPLPDGHPAALPAGQPADGNTAWVDRIEVCSVAMSLLELLTEVARHSTELTSEHPGHARDLLNSLPEAIQDTPDFAKDAQEVLDVQHPAA